MATENADLLKAARESLKDKWGLAIGTFLVYTLIMCSFGAMQKVGLASLLVAGPMALGAAIFSLTLSRGQDARLEQLFDGFKFFTNALITYLLTVLYVILWTLLLIVPGIIAALSYSMVFYILADNPTLKPQEILDQSKKMTDGYKWKLFYLCLHFFLLALLCVLTLGIGFLWLIPYVHITMAKFYDDLKNNQIPQRESRG
ncbi:DUF975 family protein [Mucilaginibacter sp. UR6-11]|uniref:DUF975 family protein n=1 Tax=Mucilaginibacter sp. UR6-11 TaxID=1435644 RepID=UPI001E63D637|nr:DUF975 family protein [Mucilaginibacter sp. UR6-11]MCC8423501.1 DUF975 family protein [Mucilaginibacter sp. UR6-11]